VVLYLTSEGQNEKRNRIMLKNEQNDHLRIESKMK
jgi:hypothetical protein